MQQKTRRGHDEETRSRPNASFWCLLSCLVLLIASPAIAQNTPAVKAKPDAATKAKPDAATKAKPDAAAPSEESSNRTGFNYLLREVGTQVERHKEETFGTKSRLMLLRASVLRRSIAGSKVVVTHNDEMGGEYELVQVLYVLDRERKLGQIAAQNDLSALDEEVVVDQKLVPGSHLLTVKMVYQGSTWGLFSYADGYVFTIESSYAFTAEEGKIHQVTVTAFEDGGVFTPLEDRPTIGYQMKIHDFEPTDPSLEAATAE